MLRGKENNFRTLILALGGLFILIAFVYADTSDTFVNVYDSNIQFIQTPAEFPASVANTPINQSGIISFLATATDDGGYKYYLAVCKTDAIIAGNNAAPTCINGAWCISNETNSGEQASCSYTIQSTDTSTSYSWYAFVCNKSPTAICTSSSQGSGNSGSPFFVNHKPTLLSVNNDGSKNPGESITFSAQGSDPDAGNSLKLLICKTPGISGIDCDGGANDTYCTSLYSGTSPACSYDIPIPTEDKNYSYYAYVFDNFNLVSSNVISGSFVVKNVIPVITNISLNSGYDISLVQRGVTDVVVTGTITDNNSCADITTVRTSFYRSDIGFSGCDDSSKADTNNCYPDVTCELMTYGNKCDGSNDVSANYICHISVQYNADPTDGNSHNIKYYDQNWRAVLKVIDNNGQTSYLEVASGVEIMSLISMNIQSSLDYGAVIRGHSTGGDPVVLDIFNTGNVGIDIEIAGSAMIGEGGSIPVENQEYGISYFTYGLGTDLSENFSEVEINIRKTLLPISPSIGKLYWGIEIPANLKAGSYTGTNRVVAVLGEVDEW